MPEVMSADAIHVLVVGVFQRSDGRVEERDSALVERVKSRKDKKPSKGTKEPSIERRKELKINGKRAFRGPSRTLAILMLMLLPACACCDRPSLPWGPRSLCARADAMEERCGKVAGIRWTGRDDDRWCS